MSGTDCWSRRPTELAVLRIVVFTIWLVLLANMDLSLFADLPAEALRPTGLVVLLPLDTLAASPHLLTAVRLVAMIGCVACVVGVRPWRGIAATTVVLLLVCDGLAKSVGWYANHAQFAPLVAAALLAVAPSADRLSLPRRAPAVPDVSSLRHGAPMFAVALLVTLSYSLVAARRIFEGGGSVFVDHSILEWSVLRSLEDHHYPWDFGLVLLENQWLLPLMATGFAITTLFELLSPLALHHRRFRVAWLAVVIPFHFGTLILMNIFFWENLLILAVLFTALPRLAGGGRSREASDPDTVARPMP